MSKIEHTTGEWDWTAYRRDGPQIALVSRDGYDVLVATGDDSASWLDIRSEGDAALLRIAKAAPHECSNEGCPGDLNRRRLEMLDSIMLGIRDTVEAHGSHCSCTMCSDGRRWLARYRELKGE